MKKVFANMAYAVAKREANQGCQWLFHQKKLPDKVKQLKETR